MKKAIFFIAGTSQAFVFKDQPISCINCVEVEGLQTCESEPGFCLPGVTACVSMQVTQTAQPELGTIYWRGCELPGHEDIPDGCTCSGERNQAFYCKKTCYTDNCNDDETMSTIDQVISDSFIDFNADKRSVRIKLQRQQPRKQHQRPTQQS